MKNKRYILLSAVLSIFFFMACSQEPIFYSIEQEIKLQKPNIEGNVHSLVKLNSSLYTANGIIYKKNLKTIRGWSEMSRPSGRTVLLASDASHLYALIALQVNEEDNIYQYQVWSSLNGTGPWEAIAGAQSTTAVVIFDNAVIGTDTSTTGRNAYVRVDKVVKKLNGNTAFASLSPIALTTNGLSEKTIAAAAQGTTDFFSNTRAFASNTTTLYRASEKTVEYSTDGTNWIKPSLTVNEIPFQFAFDTDRIIVGTEQGLQVIQLNSSGIPTSIGDLANNAESTVGESEILCVSAFGSVDNNAIYAGATRRYDSKNNALWGYYPSRGNWNYE